MSVLKIKDSQNNWQSIPTINGETPVKGTDYWTSADKDEIVDYVLDSGEVVGDVQIEGTSILNNGVANIQYANATKIGVIKLGDGFSTDTSTLKTNIDFANADQIKAGSSQKKTVAPYQQHRSVFYGLTKAAGVDMASSSNAVGTYTDDAKSAIKTMLGVEDPTVDDVQINGASIVNNGVANFETAGPGKFGLVQVSGYGLQMQSNGYISTKTSTPTEIKNGARSWEHISPGNQHIATFYGLAKAAGDATQSASSNTVGTYTEEAKKAIRKMLGIPNMTSELIYETTTTEDLERLDIATDTNGLPFALRVCKIYVKLSASTTGKADYIITEYVVTKTDDTDFTNSFPTLKMTTATGALLTYEAEAFPGGMYFIRGYVSNNFGSSSNNGISMNYDRLIKFIKKITIKQYSQTSTLIPAGTNIKLYGIRYDD